MWQRTGSLLTYVDGNVGIGTAAPSETLEIFKDGGAIIKLHDPGNNSWKLKADTDFHIYDDTGSDYLTIKNSGNVGIGVTAPLAKLAVNGVSDTAGTGVLEIKTSTTNLKIGGATTYSYIQSHSSQPLYFNVLGNNVIINPNGGNVGIGTTGPGAKLEVNGDILLTYLKATGNSVIGGTSINSSRLSVQDSKNGTANSPHFQILGNGYSAYHYLDTTAYNIVTNSTTREIRVIAQNGGVKLAYAATAWAANSDIALKENIKPLENVLDKIKDYRCVEYNLKESPEDKKIGFIAQDWVDDFPAIVNKDEKDMLGMKYTETIPVLLKAIQELTARIKELENK